MAAAQSDSISAIKILLMHGAQITERDRDGNTLLIGSMPAGVEMARYLLSRGLDSNAWNKVGRTALMQALQNGFILQVSWSGKARLYRLVKLLLDHGASPNIQDQKGRTALMETVEWVHDPEIVKLLLRHGADPNEKDKDGETALRLASEYQNKILVQLLSSTGAFNRNK